MDWKECVITKIVKKKSVDKELISSILKMRKWKLKAYHKLSEENDLISIQFTVAYDYLRETIEALALSKGFKIGNHECYTAFLKEVCKLQTEAAIFDRAKFIRNGIQYCSKDMPLEEGKKLIPQLFSLVKFLEKQINEK